MTTDQKFSQATSTIPIVMSAGDVLLSRSELPIDGRHRQYSRVCTSAMSGVGTDRQCCSTESISAVEGRPAVLWRRPVF